ncbi:MAG: ABC transporter ATP-binding protein [Fastidiosipilaceae bacterium]|jgi:iron complex transport system ATP-binding protein
MIIKVQNGCFAYHGQATILRDINIELKMGRILSVLGPNGIGKTTLLKCMTGLLPWKSGRTLFDDRDIRDIKSKDFWSMVSYIPQARGFSFSYTGLEMVMLGRSAHLGMFEQPGQREIELAQNTMERIGVAHLQKKDCNQMSGGELQMVLIARALINEPKLIILDEPETGLDFHNQILVLDMIDRLAHQEGISAIMNTHYPTNAMSISDEALMMNREGDFYYGAAEQVLNERNISRSFDVRVAVNEFRYENKKIKSIVPVAIC